MTAAGRETHGTLVLAAGGTGGHVFPALAVASEATRRGVQVALVGGATGPEATWCREAGVPFVGVPTGKWDRQRPDPRAFVRAALGPLHAIRWMQRTRPAVVLGMGGFASFPACVAALATGTPLVLHEGNAYPGRVTRWFARRAAGIASGYDEALTTLMPSGERVGREDRVSRPMRPTVTRSIGLPVREVRYPRDEARTRLGLPLDGTVTLVMGGSQGSLALNDVVPVVAARLGEARGAVLHAAGRPWVERVEAAKPSNGAYRVVDFVDAAVAWSAVDLAIVRGGTSTLSEAAFHGVPAIVVPLPTSAEDHQRANARSVHEAGAGRYVEQDDPDALAHAWTALLDDDARAAAAAAMSARSPRGAAAELFEFAMEFAKTDVRSSRSTR